MVLSALVSTLHGHTPVPWISSVTSCDHAHTGNTQTGAHACAVYMHAMHVHNTLGRTGLAHLRVVLVA